MISSPKSNHCPLSTGYHSFSYDSDHFQKIESPSTSSSSTSASIAKEHHLSSSRSPQIEQSHPADSLDPAFIECLLAATNQSGITTAPLVDKSSFSSSLLQLPPSSAQLAPKSAPFSSLTTPCWTSTTPDSGACFPTIPLTGTEQWTCSTLGLTTVPFNPFGLYTPTTGQMPASADHSGTFDPMTSVPLPQGPCWPPTYMPSANHQPLAPSYLGPSDYYIDPSATYDSSTQPSSPEHVYSSNNTSTCATAQTSPQSAHFQALLGSGSEHASYPLLVPQNRKRSATINTTSSTAPSTSPNTPPIPAYTTHENPYPLMNHRPSVARQPSAPALSMPSSSTLNPDAHTREALARQLGPDVKPKTLQIWFQNRRSKSRAKEREANLPKRLDVRDRSTPPTRNVSATATKRCVNSEALKALAHDDDRE
ncbi:hypothetical protein BD324DRAFT_137053 [Kockovaella imperatae]|uniref:Homeobox domain-containing protein n=1 Tax=Kockovaella imperatae TaxID=4999 RepID=A0A1Y1UBC9_9TREE|nr:hypothetical protein BD324DRAFT_137053 [Kockovaella imperatae]ORX34834.1 hypothetical protein BD324DRAFT_137053 [Kockovaella imperatae]